MQLLWIFLGGGLGSVCRYLVSRLVGVDQVFPFATLSANFLASFMLGLLFGMAGNDILSERQKLFFMTGFCGGFSTFSTFSTLFVTVFVQYNSFDSSVVLISPTIAMGVSQPSIRIKMHGPGLCALVQSISSDTPTMNV